MINNLLNEVYRDNWIQLGKVKYCNTVHFIILSFQTSPTTSQNLVRDTEQLAKLLSNTLTNDTKEINKSRSNIGKANS